MIFGNADHIDASDQIVEPYPVEDWNPERLFETCFICQPATFFRRRTVSKYGGLDTSLDLCLDYEYWIRLARMGARFLRLPATLAGSRLHPETKTNSKRVEAHREINDMLRDHLGEVPDSWIFGYAHVWVDQYCSRDRRLTFSALAGLASWVSAVRWNRGVSSGIRRKTFRWLAGNLRARLSSREETS